MNIYAYKGNKELGQEELGTFNKLMFSDLKSKWGILRRCRQAFKGNDFRVYSYSNFYDDKTFREIDH
jgi:hypothetical protein